jgi:hypothetical protein
LYKAHACNTKHRKEENYDYLGHKIIIKLKRLKVIRKEKSTNQDLQRNSSRNQNGQESKLAST